MQWQEHKKSELVKTASGVLSSLHLGGKGPRVMPPSIEEVVEKSRACFPLGFGHSTYYVSRRTAIIGLVEFKNCNK